MRRPLVGPFVVLIVAIALLAPAFVFGQMDMPGGGGGFRRGGGRGGRFRRDGMFPPPVVNPQPTPATETPKEPEKKDAKPGDAKPDAAPPDVIRPPAADNSDSMRDQRLSADDKGLVRLTFQEAPWTFVLEEISRLSKMTLDWTTLPGDALNLRSSGRYTVPQARDIVNGHLLARGYSMLVNPKTSTIEVVKLKTLNTALVPRVAPEDLDNLQPHELVKVQFRLSWLLADKAVEEFKQMLSPDAKLMALKATNRLEAIDAVENLKQLAAVIEEEQGGRNGDRLVRTFDLRYTRAPEVLDKLQNFLGIKKDANAPPKSMAEAQAQMLMMQQRMQQQPGQPGQPAAAQAPKPEVHLMADTRLNCIFVHAPPDQMAIVQAAIYKIDVPLPSERPSLSEAGHSMKPYRLATLDPEVLMSLLESIGDLDPQTRLEVDKKNKALIAYASPRDHKAISDLVKNLDGSDRELNVIKLRRLDAVEVAGTLRILLVGEDKVTNANNNNGGGRRRFGWGYDPFASQNNTDDASTSKFRIDADSANNRLIVFANQIEYEQVLKCLAQLGEVPRKDRGRETTRVLDLGSRGEDEEVLERLQRLWPSLGKDMNKLIIDLPEKKPASATEPKPETGQKPDKERAKAQPAEKGESAPKIPAANGAKAPGPVTQRDKIPQSVFRLAGLEQESPSADRTLAYADDTDTPKKSRRKAPRRAGGYEEPAAQDSPPITRVAPPKIGLDNAPLDPIIISRGPDGKLIIHSRDTQALDALEEMIARLSPPRKDYEVFYLHHVSAYDMKLTLKEFFDEDKKESGNSRRNWYFYDDSSSDKKDEGLRLSSRKPMRIIDDSQTNSLLVQGATAEQLRRIKELIDLYDKPAPAATKATRVTKSFKIKHSKASVIADAIKDVYRDLLSPNDKALESYNQTKSKGKERVIYDFDGRGDEDGKMNQASFKGQMSIGVDENSNLLLVSCRQYMMTSVDQIVEWMDQAAVPTAQSMQVLKIDRSIDAGSLQKKLMEMMGKHVPTAGEGNHQANPQHPQQQKRGKGQQQQHNEQEASESSNSTSNE